MEHRFRRNSTTRRLEARLFPRATPLYDRIRPRLRVHLSGAQARRRLPCDASRWPSARLVVTPSLSGLWGRNCSPPRRSIQWLTSDSRQPTRFGLIRTWLRELAAVSHSPECRRGDAQSLHHLGTAEKARWRLRRLRRRQRAGVRDLRFRWFGGSTLGCRVVERGAPVRRLVDALRVRDADGGCFRVRESSLQRSPVTAREVSAHSMRGGQGSSRRAAALIHTAIVRVRNRFVKSWALLRLRYNQRSL